MALLLSLTLFWAWAACICVCAENVAHYNHANALETNWQIDDNCSGKTADCTIITITAVHQERQNIKLFASAVPFGSALRVRALRSVWLALLPDINQNSPPGIYSEPLFVRFCTFRI